MEKIFFENWDSIARTCIITLLAYSAMIVLLRASGKRTLSKMNAFDFIVTVALGSSLATVALTKSVPLADGVLAFFLFIFLQYLITWLSVRVKWFSKMVTSQPTLLIYKGEVLHAVLKKERITIEELYVAARKKGIAELKSIDVAVLETTGDVTIIDQFQATSAQTLSDVKNHPEP
jgi:uncharacterized membrane protein YcaP (DUF421 family)